MSFELPNLKRLTGSLSIRLLGLTLLWVFFITVATGYTFLLGWKTQEHIDILRNIVSIRGDIFRVNLFIDETFTEAEFKEEIARVDSEILKLGEDLKQGDLEHKKLLLERAEKINHIWFNYLRGEMIEGKANVKPLDAEKLGFVIPFIREFRIILQEDRDREVKSIQRAQIFLLVMSFLSLFMILFLLLRWVIHPTDQLVEVLHKVSKGDLSVRMPEKGANEFVRISNGFNRMSERLEELVSDLEAKAQEKTFAVEERNRNLSQLYELTSYLGKNFSKEEICDSFTLRMIHYTGAAACAVLLVDANTRQLHLASQIDLPEPMSQLLRSGPVIYEDLNEIMDLHKGFLIQDDLQGPFKEMLAVNQSYKTIYGFHVRTGIDSVGLYLLFYRNKITLSARRNQLYENFGTHLAAAIETRRLIERDRQSAVLQERSFLARGLHDSIAQSLSFLNLQVQLLESGLKKKDKELISESVQQIKTGVQESYEDVRELLTNFRERLHQESFEQALKSALNRFELQTHVKVKFSQRGELPLLNEQQKLQTIFILQEALANVRKHAESTEVSVVADNAKDFQLRISDNGVGFDESFVQSKKNSHYGLTIMKERADRIGANVAVVPVKHSIYPHGTSVLLTIPSHRILRAQ